MRLPRPYLTNLNLSEARIAFRLETHMLDIASNMKQKYKGRMQCIACTDGVEESQEHIEVCGGYAHLRGVYDLYDMGDKARFYSKVMVDRAKKGRV